MVSPELLRAWIATRPLSVRKLAAEFPLMSPIPLAMTKDLGDEQFFVIGYNEDDFLIVAKHLFAEADERHYLCADHLRKPT